MAFAIKVNRTLHSVDVDGDTPCSEYCANVMGMTGTNATAGRATDGRWLTLRALSGFGRVFCLRVFPQERRWRLAGPIPEAPRRGSRISQLTAIRRAGIASTAPRMQPGSRP